uniref:EamA domain-containing protein n=1 Tax=Globisporangium ultimum (strain ATCC 200006 / CBS 805.95 / DAOM BR144) TaxID=431595 RepID=K3WT08_GLOUD
MSPTMETQLPTHTSLNAPRSSEDMSPLRAALATLNAVARSAVVHKYAVQGVFLFTGVYSTCAAQYVFYQGAGDQKAMLLPLCNYLGIMMVGLIPLKKSNGGASSTQREDDVVMTPSSTRSSVATASTSDGFEIDAENEFGDEQDERKVLIVDDEPERTPIPSKSLMTESMELTRRQAGDHYMVESDNNAVTASSSVEIQETPSSIKVYCSFSQVQVCIFVSIVLDFAGCIFSNIELSMASSGLYQVVYSSVICWSALMSRFILKKQVSKEEWGGIALVTFGLAFSALGGSSGGRDSYVVLMGCFNTLLGAAFYGGNYVAGEYTLKLPERPEPKELCLKLGTACVAVIAVYQCFFVLPHWHELVTAPIAEANGSTSGILTALGGYTLSQLAHGITYFMMLGSSGAVTTGIMQSLRAVCVFAISSLLYCSKQESQCFDTKRGIATMIVVSGVMFYSWAKSQAASAPKAAAAAAARHPMRSKNKMVAGKNYVV